MVSIDSLHDQAALNVSGGTADWLVVIAIVVGLLVALLGRRCWPAMATGARRCWLALRSIVGWGCIGIGVLGLILPGPGIPLLVLGAALVGRRHPLLRRTIVPFKAQLRAWARQPGVRGRLAKHGQELLRQQRRLMDQVLAGQWRTRNADAVGEDAERGGWSARRGTPDGWRKNRP